MACTFDGTTNSRLTLASPPALVMPFTIALWFRVTAASTKTMWSLASAVSDTNYFSVQSFTGSQPGATKRDGGGEQNSLTTNNPYSTNTWTHLAGVFTSTTSHRIYMSGVAGGENTTLTLPVVSRMGIGTLYRPTEAGLWTGDLAEVAWWDSALSQANITALQTGCPDSVAPSSLQAWWRLLTSGTATVDSKNGFTLTGGSALVTTDGPAGICTAIPPKPKKTKWVSDGSDMEEAFLFENSLLPNYIRRFLTRSPVSNPPPGGGGAGTSGTKRYRMHHHG